MTDDAWGPIMAEATALALLAGAALAAAHLGLIWAGARALRGPRPVILFAALAASRVIMLAGAMAAALSLGAGAAEIAAATVGFMATRTAAVRRVGGAG